VCVCVWCVCVKESSKSGIVLKVAYSCALMTAGIYHAVLYKHFNNISVKIRITSRGNFTQYQNQLQQDKSQD